MIIIKLKKKTTGVELKGKNMVVGGDVVPHVGAQK